MRNRWYDPQTGRFLSQDPIGLAGGVNLYAYAGNNPASFSDPFGLCPPQDKEDGPWCHSPGYWLLTHVGVEPEKAAKWTKIGYGGATLIGPGVGMAVRGSGAALGAATRAAAAEEATVAAAASEGPLPGTTYTPKVVKQIASGDNHAFPKLVDQFAADGAATKVVGGDGVPRTHIRLPGSKNGKDGAYTWIIDPDGSVNHRQFEIDK
jgi:uncharacterized protein RhaS with RHS repeats